MSLINVNKNYLETMGIAKEDPQVGVIVAVYYIGCSIGAVLFSWLADRLGRRAGLFGCLATCALGNLICFIAGLGFSRGALPVMYVGRVIMGLGVGGVDSVVPTYSSELSDDDARGKAMAQEFQANIFGLNLAFAINLVAARALGKSNQWAWRIPIIAMQIFPLSLLAFVGELPESPRWLAGKGNQEEATKALKRFHDEETAKKRSEELVKAAEDDEGNSVSYKDMLTPGHIQFHPTMLTVMGQINQALTGYGCLSVYGPQIFELLGYGTSKAEYLTQGNYVSYFLLMTFAWVLVDAVGRRTILLYGSGVLILSFLLLTVFAGLAMNADDLGIHQNAVAIPGIVVLFIATGAFGIGWLVPPWLIPTEIYPTTARAKGTAISVITWGFANFVVTLMSPILFNNLKFYIFLVFAGTNTIAGVWTYLYCPETGGRSFEENQEYFEDAKDEKSWRVHKVGKGKFRWLPYPKPGGEEGETQPLLQRIADQVS
ncbi:general substrate transporter [Dissoconium aciculare CBS 342.82]|uniref:General substrate transporter n=1 Tax=Dissoconium aciculare CBS 342.82 TaxID=1314786 RepID=A0A6J3MH74_9PEZI|nr:general substrate transporter [Dissoconium aciculare CBS 342.82]KAF1827301.1 general substrate transporter [Dissoconium aciculare CBS 342.82]